ncbi:MAG: transporter [Gemmatimonadaceae bacterium]|nr:transporter [Gemmatimonadaceae bacterium]
MHSHWITITALVSVLATPALQAQTDYYNTDTGRPVQIEDAYATERYAFEFKVPSIQLERANGGTYSWGLEPEIGYGIAPRTSVEISLPLAYREAGGRGSSSGVAGLELSVFHNLNMETQSFPAFGLRADVVLPVGRLGPERTYTSAKAIMTRTFSRARLHVNGQYTFGASPDNPRSGTESGAREISRWLTGVAIDRTFPLKSTLLIADLYARQPIDESEDADFNLGTGIRYQVSPSFLLDGGVGRRLNGPDQGWAATFSATYAFALRSLFPVNGR